MSGLEQLDDHEFVFTEQDFVHADQNRDVDASHDVMSSSVSAKSPTNQTASTSHLQDQVAQSKLAVDQNQAVDTRDQVAARAPQATTHKSSSKWLIVGCLMGFLLFISIVIVVALYLIRPGSTAASGQMAAPAATGAGGRQGLESNFATPPSALTETPQIGDGHGVSTVAPIPGGPQNMTQEQQDDYYDRFVEGASSVPVEQGVSLDSPVDSAAPEVPQTAPVADIPAPVVPDQLAKMSNEMGAVLEAVKAVQQEVASIKAQTDKNTEKTAQLETLLKGVSSKVDTAAQKNDERFGSVIKEAVAASLDAVNKIEQGRSSKMVLKGGPVVSDAAKAQPKTQVQQHVSSSPQTTQIKPQLPVANVVRSEPNGLSPAAACGAKTVSQNWKVKGVTGTGAFIRRVDDVALLIRVDMEVPGFGVVKSFDPVSRTVCTTQGLIAR